MVCYPHTSSHSGSDLRCGKILAMTLYSEFADAYNASYTQCSVPLIDRSFIRDVLGRDNQTGADFLFIGSYFSLLEDYQPERLTICDLSLEMLKIGEKLLPNARSVLANATKLPFQSTFQNILMVGGVTAHMLRDADLQSCAHSLAQAIKPGGLLVIDAYAAESIADSTYFNGTVEFKLGGTRWYRTAKILKRSNDPTMLEVSVSLQAIESQKSCHETLLQRAFSIEELSTPFLSHDFKLIRSSHDHVLGRRYLMFQFSGV